MKESEVRAICKKHKFSSAKKYTRFQNNHGVPWLHIEDLHGDGFIEWYDGFKVFATFNHSMDKTTAWRYAEFLLRALDLINELESNGVTEENIQLRI